VSRIEGAAHYRNLSRLVAARMRTRAGDRAALDEVAEVMGGAEVEFALQHLPRYQMIAGDAHADVGDAETARAYYAQSLKGGPCGSQQWLRSEVLCRLGSLAAGVGSAAEAERLFVDALQTAQTQGASLFELRAALALARSGGDEALGALEKICDRLEEGGPDVVAARKLLAERAGPRRKLARRR
jgi:tetratricopeptide (TPR) repeat protein